MIIITDRLQSKTLVTIGLVVSAITFASFPFARSIVEILPSQVLLGLSWACLYVGALKFVTENNDDRSTASGLLASILALCGVIGPVIAAVIYSIWPGYAPIMFFAAFMSVISLVIFWYNTHRQSYIDTFENGIPIVEKE
jgi:MFS family permease